MCGIAGFVGSRALDRGHLERLTGALRHRGPDGDGFHLDPRHGAGLGHRRLSILDPGARGAQPMTFGDHDTRIVLNGEIYNFLELRRELESAGLRFRTETDTEVALASFLHWGEAAFARWNGMWAVAILDGRKGELTLCRDRYGVKPLYYREGDGLVFASETKAFWALAAELGASWDTRGLLTALRGHGDLECSGRTLVTGVQKLPPGHLCTVTADGRARPRRWWSTVDHLVTVPPTLDEQAEALRALLLDAARLRMRSDVPIGSTLSGGVDSGSVVSVIGELARRGGGERAAADCHRAFTHQYPGSPEDESELSALVARRAGSTMRPVLMRPDDLLATLDRVVADCGFVPRGMPDSWWRVYRAQRAEGVTVSLDGHGSDELFGGYARHLAAGGARPPWRARVRRLARTAVRAALAPATEFTTAAGRAVAGYRPEPLPAPPRSWGPLDRVLYEDFHRAILPGTLRDFDAVSMAHGVEARMPFMDYRLVSFGFSLPPASRVAGGVGKVVLRRAMRGLVPDEVIGRRQKVPFIGPHRRWIPVLRPWLEAAISGRGALDGLVAVDRLRAYLAGRDAGWTRPDTMEDGKLLRFAFTLRLVAMSPAELAGAC